MGNLKTRPFIFMLMMFKLTTTSMVCAKAEVKSGANSVEVKVNDAIGNAYSLNDLIYAGGSEVTVNLKGLDGTAFASSATVTAFLADDQRVSFTTLTHSGQVQIGNLPANTVISIAEGGNGEIGNGAVAVGAQGSIDIAMHGFNPPVAQLDFGFVDKDLAGWQGGGSFSLVPYDVNVGPIFLDQDIVIRRNLLPDGSNFPKNTLRLFTNYQEASQHASYTFEVAKYPGLKSVFFSLEWRFQTDEIPVWFGSQYNDQFTIIIRSMKSSIPPLTIAHSMNGLGLEAFDSNGSTSRHPVTMELGLDADVVQLDLWVANVADDYLQSQVFIDSMVLYEYVEEEHPWLTAIKKCNQDRKWCAWGKNPEGWDSEVNNALVRSHEAATYRTKNHLDKNDLLMKRFLQVSIEKSIPLPLLLALASRESAFGGQLGLGGCDSGWGDEQLARDCKGEVINGQCWGYGVLQMDKCFHMPKIQSAIDSDGPLGFTHIRAAADIFLQCFQDVEKKFADGANLAEKDAQNGLVWTGPFVLKGAAVCYNSGIGNVRSTSSMDVGTANNDYGSDIMTQAGWFVNMLDGTDTVNQPDSSGDEPGDCRTSNNEIAGTCAGYCWTKRAAYLRDTIHDCFPGIKISTYPGHDSGNGLDIWVDESGAFAVANTLNALDLSEAHESLIFDVADWLMESHKSLRIYYLIFNEAIWNPSRDASGIWADCCSTGRCYCATSSPLTGYDITQSHRDHLHISVLAS